MIKNHWFIWSYNKGTGARSSLKEIKSMRDFILSYFLFMPRTLIMVISFVYHIQPKKRKKLPIEVQ